MENNNDQQVEITSTPESLDAIATSLLKMEPEVINDSNMSKCCIYTVPEYIRKGKEEFYQPLSTSIGPVFYKDPRLETMQELKRIYLKNFRSHLYIASQSFHPYIEFVKENETRIRGCYQHKFNLSSVEFIQLIVLDAAFLIYLFLAVCQNFLFMDDKFRVPFSGLLQDLFLEENQLPFFVLTGIYNIAFGEISIQAPFLDLTLETMQHLCRDFPVPEAINYIKGKNVINPSEVSHLVDLRRTCCCLHVYEQWKSNKKPSRFDAIKSMIDCNNFINVTTCRVNLQRMSTCCLPLYHRQKELINKEPHFLKFNSAKHLSAAGVKFELSGSNNPFDITFNKNNGVLRIPKLTLEDRTEAALRSILFFEQCRMTRNDKNYISDYVCFIDRLIDTAEDVHVLQKSEILDHHLGSDEDVADLFNKLNREVSLDPRNFAFSNASEGLKDYSSGRRNRWKAILWSKYFDHPWAIISVAYAIILLILTILQTITSFL